MMLRYLIEKEFKQLKRNSFLPRLILLFPCMMMLVMPWAATLEIENLRIAVIDNDRSPSSERLVHHIEASRYFQLTALPRPTHKDCKPSRQTRPTCCWKFHAALRKRKPTDKVRRHSLQSTPLTARKADCLPPSAACRNGHKASPTSIRYATLWKPCAWST